MHFGCGDLIAFNYEVNLFDPEELDGFGGFTCIRSIETLKPTLCLAIDESFMFKRLRLFILNDARLACAVVHERDVILVSKFEPKFSGNP